MTFFFSSEPTLIHVAWCWMLPGGPGDKGQDDGVRNDHGQLPTAGGQGQLFPHGDLKSCRDLRGHRLSYWRDWTTRPRSIRLISPNPHPPCTFLLLTDELFVVNVLVIFFLFSFSLSSKVTYLRVYLRKKTYRYIYILCIVAFAVDYLGPKLCKSASVCLSYSVVAPRVV